MLTRPILVDCFHQGYQVIMLLAFWSSEHPVCSEHPHFHECLLWPFLLLFHRGCTVQLTFCLSLAYLEWVCAPCSIHQLREVLCIDKWLIVSQDNLSVIPIPLECIDFFTVPRIAVSYWEESVENRADFNKEFVQVVETVDKGRYISLSTQKWDLDQSVSMFLLDEMNALLCDWKEPLALTVCFRWLPAILPRFLLQTVNALYTVGLKWSLVKVIINIVCRHR